jgi:decaprenylphospho-beta-D-ribofuranose 2-oxidase
MTLAVEVSPEPLCGWGRTTPTRALVSRPVDVASVELALRTHRDGVIARGLGRSYGDAAQCSGGLTIDTAGLSHIGVLDESSGTIEVGGGVSLHDLMRHIIPAGWFVAVTPGTRSVSVGGAIAADVHGKNHHRDGSFARHVAEMTLVTPVGTFSVSPERDPDLFWATAGGMGLTGVVVSATMRLIPIETSWMRVDGRRFGRLEDLMSEMEETDDAYHYSVAWLDCVGHHDRRQRSVLTRGDHASAGAIPDRWRGRSREVPREPRIQIPRAAPRRVANRLSVRALNEAWFRAASTSQGSLRPLSSFFHPLDGVGRWNLLYGPDGFVQYQFAVPPGRADVVETGVTAIASSGVPSFLAVLKRFGPGTPGPLSFAQPGWTLALDFPIGPPALPGLLDRLDDQVASAGGRVYLAKDARLRPDLLPTMYPRLEEMRTVCRRVDPEGVLASDLSRRLGVTR